MKSCDARNTMRKPERGFTLTELTIATVVLLVGVVAVMQLVPNAIQSNLRNRQDTSSAVVAQRLRELFTRQKVTDPAVVDPSGLLPCTAAGECQFGDPAQNDRVVGSAVRRVTNPKGQVIDVQIDFSGAAQAGYNFIYIDPNDPTRTPYEVRWAVVTSIRNVGTQLNVPVTKRLIVAARRQGDRSQSVWFNTLMVR